MNFTNNNLLSDLAKCCELAALHERQKDDDERAGKTNEYVVGRRYKMAAQLYAKAASASIGHNRTARYYECEDNAKELSDIAFNKYKQQTTGL